MITEDDNTEESVIITADKKNKAKHRAKKDDSDDNSEELSVKITTEKNRKKKKSPPNSESKKKSSKSSKSRIEVDEDDEDDEDEKSVTVTPLNKIKVDSDIRTKIKSYTKSESDSDVEVDSDEEEADTKTKKKKNSNSGESEEDIVKSDKKKKKSNKKEVASEDNAEEDAESDAKSDSKTDDEFEKLLKFMMKYMNKPEKKGMRLPCNYTTVDSPKGAFNIPDDRINTFVDLYVDAVYAGKSLTITERHKDFGPIVIDLDFIQSKENSQRFYSEQTIKNCIKLYNNIIVKYLNVEDGDLIAFVTEKEKPILRKGEYHDGIHIMYPNICTKPTLQMMMREDFIKKLEEKNIFKKIPLLNQMKDVVDEAVIYRNGWLMYGSKKSNFTEGSTYLLTHIYETVSDEGSMVIQDTFDPDVEMTKKKLKTLIKTLSVRKFDSEDDLTPLGDDVDPKSINDKSVRMKNAIIEEKGVDKAERLLSPNINFIKATTEKELVEAKNLIKLFSRERADKYQTWYQIGMCLHNIDYRLLEDWIKFSKRCIRPVFKPGECEKLWKKMKTSTYNMASLHYFASKDNPKEYIKYINEKSETLTKEAIRVPQHHSFAKLLMSRYRFRFKCASIKHNLWYEFRKHRWIRIDDAYTLRNLISEDLPEAFADKQRALYAEVGRKPDKKDEILRKAESIGKIIRDLNNNTFKNGIIRECSSLAYDPNFLKNLDENINLICFENGVYELKDGYFREGCPDDYISLCTNYDYIEYEPDDEHIVAITDFLSKIQPEEEMRDYLIRLLSTCLAGSVKEESFYVFTGGGGNGKTKLMELLRYALGDYFKPMDVRLLTEKRANSSAASPEVADKKGIRACTMDEPNANDEINTGFMKLFTGGDEITARALFQEPIYFKPQFKPFLLCNKLPSIRADDDGTWRRLKVIFFGSKFIKPQDVPKKYKKNGFPKNTFLADLDIVEKLKEWKQAFMSMLIIAYKDYLREGLKHPKAVLRETKNYQKKCDIYQDYITDCLERTDKVKDTISVMNMHDMMKKWYKSNYDGKCPNAKDLRNYLEKRTDNYSKKRDMFVGYKIKTLDANADVNDLDEMDED
jgi:P4 family phage/plasmid primase-like protien